MTKIQNNLPPKPVKPPKNSFGWLFMIGLFFCLVFGYTWIRTESTRTILSISNDQKTLTALRSHNQALTVEIERLKSEERIIRIAKTQLNLTAGSSDRIIYYAGEEKN